MPYVDMPGKRIWFEDSGGAGPAVVLGHGFLLDHTMFDPQVAALSPEIRIIRWDARAHGKTEWDGQPFTYWDSAGDLVALLDHLGLDRAIVGGMSQGGFVALRAALGHPERIAGLVLIDTQAGVDDEATRARYRAMREAWLTHGPVDALVTEVAASILGPREHWEPWISRWRDTPTDRIRESSHCLFWRDDITSRVGEIRCPAIVFHGTADAAIPMARAEALASLLPGCEGLVRVEGAPHASNLTHPAGVNPALRQFVLRHG